MSITRAETYVPATSLLPNSNPQFFGAEPQIAVMSRSGSRCVMSAGSMGRTWREYLPTKIWTPLQERNLFHCPLQCTNQGAAKKQFHSIHLYLPKICNVDFVIVIVRRWKDVLEIRNIDTGRSSLARARVESVHRFTDAFSFSVALAYCRRKQIIYCILVVEWLVLNARSWVKRHYYSFNKYSMHSFFDGTNNQKNFMFQFSTITNYGNASLRLWWHERHCLIIVFSLNRNERIQCMSLNAQFDASKNVRMCHTLSNVATLNRCMELYASSDGKKVCWIAAMNMFLKNAILNFYIFLLSCNASL